MRKLLNEELNRIDIETFKTATKTPLIVVLDNIRSLNNIGSVFRSADAFRIKKIYLCGITCKPPHRDINKTALGATDSVDWEYIESITECLSELKKQNIKIVGIEQTNKSIALSEFNPPKQQDTAVIFGNEVHGICDEALKFLDQAVEIPQIGTKHSLNISVSCGIVLYDLANKLKAI